MPFIVGASRSGTTMLRLMIDAHSDIAIPPETNFGPALEAFARGGAQAAVDAIVDTDQWGDCGLSANRFAQRVRGCNSYDLHDVLRVFYEMYAELHGKRRWGDKSPYYLYMMNRIQQIIPEARFVHIIRDGRDVALSIIPLWFGPNTIAEAALWWSKNIDLARRQASDLRFYTEIRYESLVRDSVATLTRVCSFLELDWEPSMLNYHQSALRRLESETVEWRRLPNVVSPRARLAIHPLIGAPPHSERTERWRNEMAEDDIQEFEQIAGDTLAELGYDVSEKVAT